MKKISFHIISVVALGLLSLTSCSSDETAPSASALSNEPPEVLVSSSNFDAPASSIAPSSENGRQSSLTSTTALSGQTTQVNYTDYYLAGQGSSWGDGEEPSLRGWTIDGAIRMEKGEEEAIAQCRSLQLFKGDMFKVANFNTDTWFGYEKLQCATNVENSFTDVGGKIYVNVSGTYDIYVTAMLAIYVDKT